MSKLDLNSSAQNWKLKAVCKNKKYLNAVIAAILKYGFINFEVLQVQVLRTEPEYDSTYTVLLWSSWFNNLKDIAVDLAEIEKQYDFNS